MVTHPSGNKLLSCSVITGPGVTILVFHAVSGYEIAIWFLPYRDPRHHLDFKNLFAWCREAGSPEVTIDEPAVVVDGHVGQAGRITALVRDPHVQTNGFQSGGGGSV